MHDERTHDAALLLVRIALAVVFIAHGGQKLFGLFGGKGLAAFAPTIVKLGLPPIMATLIAIGEFFGGVALVLGLLTFVAALGLVIDMAVAIATVSHKFSFFSQPKVGYGWELNLALIGLAAALAIVGPGAWSLDAAAGLTRRR